MIHEYIHENCCATCKHSVSTVSDLVVECNCSLRWDGPRKMFGSEKCDEFERSINYQSPAASDR